MNKPAGSVAGQLSHGGSAPRILVVRVGAMGDVLHALPAVAALRQALPGACLGWAIEPRWAALLRAEGATARDPNGMPLVDRVHAVEARLWNRAPLSRTTLHSVLRLRRELRAAAYDLVLDVQGTLRSAAIARLGGGALFGGPPVLGPAAPRERPARLFYTHPIEQHSTHVVDRGLELAAAALALLRAPDLPASAAAGHPAPRTLPLPRDPAAEAWWQARAAELCHGRPPVLLAVTAGWGAKEWPRAHFAALAAHLAESGYAVLLNTAPGIVDPATAEVLQLVATRSPAVARHVHAFGSALPQLVAATRSMRAVVAGDTGPLHLAGALGIPTLGLFGPTDPARTGPGRNGPGTAQGAVPQGRSVVLRHPSSTTDHRRHAQTEAGLARLSLESVTAALDDLLRAGEGARREVR